MLAELHELTAHIEHASEQERTRIAREIHDELGQRLAGLKMRLAQDFSEKHDIRCVADCTDIETGAGTATALFRITQEALTNVAKHAGATEVRIRLRAEGGGIELSVADNGKGIEASGRPKPGSFGLLGIKERVSSLQGMVEIGTAPGAEPCSE
jgi:signal transduction histidine kinase